MPRSEAFLASRERATDAAISLGQKLDPVSLRELKAIVDHMMETELELAECEKARDEVLELELPKRRMELAHG